MTTPPAAPTLYGEVQWHLAEITKSVEHGPAPLDPDLLRIVLRGLAELCRLAYERGHEAPAVPTSLFRDSPVVSEALHMWEARLRTAQTARRRAAQAPDGAGLSPGGTGTSSAWAANSSERTSATRP